MVKQKEDLLKGMNEIKRYAKRSEATVIAWIKQREFPAKKIDTGIWMSTTQKIDTWFKEQLK